METEVSKDTLGQGTSRGGWEEALEGAWELDQGTRANYRHIILAFKAFCDQHGDGVAIQQAREFVQSEHLARGVGPSEFQQWKEAGRTQPTDHPH